MTTDDMSHEIHNNFASKMHDKYVTPGKICEKCKEHPAVKINRWGEIKACCQSCLDEEWKVFDAHRKADREAEREWEEKYGY